MDGIKGESPDDKHKDEIVVLSWGFGISFMHDASGPTGRGGRSEFGNLNITKAVDLASVDLYQRCATGKPLETAVLTLQSATGDKKMDYMKIEMEDVHVTSISPSGAGDQPMEGMTLSYGTIKWSYTQFDVMTGAKKGQAVKGWDLREKKNL